MPSPSPSAFPESATNGQPSAAFSMPSASRSSGKRLVHPSVASRGQGSQASPRPSPSASAWRPSSNGRTGSNTRGQASSSFGTPSPSRSASLTTPSYSPGRAGTQLGSFSGSAHAASG